MEKGWQSHESPPPYNEPPMMAGGGGTPHPGMCPQPGCSPAGYPGGPPPGVYPQPNFSPSPSHYPVNPAAVHYAPIQTAPVTIVTQMMPLEDIPGQAVCPHCHQTVLTKIEHTAGFFAWIMCAVLAVMGCFLCVCIPLVTDCCKDVEHRCSSCNNLIYVYKRNQHYGYPRSRGYYTHPYR
ncbi:unnamed protein product [Ophioblennius macclurei]